ncbi:MAG: hypothetical protein IPL96_15755 [Holophagaceae bacterium]|nr:hypothetical protein [Holophagaceae bacterium]
MALMKALCAERGLSFLVASHDPSVIATADVVFRLSDGLLTGTGGAAMTCWPASPLAPTCAATAAARGSRSS